MKRLIQIYKQRDKVKKDARKKRLNDEFKIREKHLKETTEKMLSKHCPIVKGNCRSDCSFYEQGKVIYDDMFGHIVFTSTCTLSK